jgi:hypothetical protein
MGSNSTLNLNGRVEKTDIPTLLRSVEKDKLTGELSFTRQSDRIDLYFLFGQLYHAKWRDTTGVAVVSELLNWRNGNYMFTEGIIPAQASINDDIEHILSQTIAGGSANEKSNPLSRPGFGAPPVTNQPRGTGTGPITPPSAFNSGSNPVSRPSITPPPNPFSLNDLAPEVAAFDLSALAGSAETQTPVVQRQPQQLPSGDPRQRLPQTAPFNHENTQRPRPQVTASVPADHALDTLVAGDAGAISDRIAPSPPAGGIYRTRYFCLPTGEQMATSLVATGPQLEEELLHLSEVSFTGYVLGSPEVEGYAAVGIALLSGRFIHAFIHGHGGQMIEGERAYRMILDQKGSQSTRFYWFYEIKAEPMRAAISLLTPPSRYVHLEARIIRIREMMQILTDERHTGCLRITVPAGSQGPNMQASPLAGDNAYLPVFQGRIMGIWTESNPRLANDGPLLQRFLSEPLAYIDLFTTVSVDEPGLPLENLVGGQTALVVDAAPVPVPTTNVTVLNPPIANPPSMPPEQPVQNLDDDERQLQLISSIGRMESIWTQMQLKDKLDEHTKLLTLAGFANEVLSLNEAVSGRRNVQEMVNRGLRQELAPFRTIFQLLDLPHGRINIIKLLKEYELFQRDSEKSGSDFYRETGRGLRTLIRSSFQYYVSLIRQEHVRFECQEMYEVFLQEVVKKM